MAPRGAGADLEWRGAAQARRRFLAKRAARRLPLPLEAGAYDVFFSPPAPATGRNVVRLARLGATSKKGRR
ncbi:MAG: hypothetical protein JNJ54_36875 [Myxococcaceae bacterium]|nr:hypothetical protein [Myxococcaceae bacterium]